MKKKIVLFTCILFIFSSLASYFELFYPMDRFVMDSFYQVPTKTNNNIRILAIDEKTLDAFGSTFGSWSREQSANLIHLLNENEDTKPAILAFDVMFIGTSEAESDERLVAACKGSDNIIMSANIVNETVLEKDATGKLVENKLSISMIEQPYPSLLPHVTTAYANTSQDNDSYIRRSIPFREYDGQVMYSLSYEIYQQYMQQLGQEARMPKTDSINRFSFAYSGKPGAYEAISLIDILDGTVDARTLKDCIVLVGAYAPGLFDAFNSSIDKGTQMYGVEVHANIVEALLEAKIVHPPHPILYALILGFMVAFFYLIVKKIKIIPGALLGISLIAIEFIVGKLMFAKGIELPLITLPIFLVVIYAYLLIKGYVEERLKRKAVVDAFKKYVAPQIVDELSKKGTFEIKLGGENRHIAVLFVDIRGFTPMSENLEPEQVVEILNAYLGLTTNSIFNNGGTLDKFIGDATMAVFNSPFDLDDYIYRAVCTARDIAAGSLDLEKMLQERFGKSVSFGIGINCGPAVVGNIGCDFRMDYTAIGDTVNTAARLESNAKRGQILISQAVYEAVKDRVEVTEIGAIPLKGKTNTVIVYSVDKVL